MSFIDELEKVYHVRYSTYNNGNVDFIADDTGKWEFDNVRESFIVYRKTVEKKEHEWVALTRTLKISEDEFKELYPDEIYPDLLTIEECLCDVDETDNEEDFTDEWVKCETKEDRLKLLGDTFDK